MCIRDRPIADLLAIGNELLNGEVRDTNMFTLSQQLTRMGFSVNCLAMVRDEPASIATILLFLLAQTPDVLICSGGLGPTDDDLTLAALARALNRPLELNAVARDLVEGHYDRLLKQNYLMRHGPEVARQKMATLPRGAQPLHNPVGTAPAVKLTHKNVRIYVLPGVPAELEAIFAESIVPELRAHFDLGVWAEQALLIHCDDEAAVVPLLRDVAGRHPSVYLKSLARPFPSAHREGLRVIAAAHASQSSTAQQIVKQALDDLHKVAEAAGWRVTSLTS